MITSEAANNTLLKISRILPISSLYLVPAEMMLGTNTISSGLISLGVNLVTMFVVILFVSKVYETIILHSGNRLKLKDILAMSKNK